ncbi:hypothetical protein [Nitrobacter vulgaris]|nr:hypothetical protein [Nitrobacter vulgaris]
MFEFNARALSGAIVEVSSFKNLLENHGVGIGRFTAHGIQDVMHSVRDLSELFVRLGLHGTPDECAHILEILGPSLGKNASALRRDLKRVIVEISAQEMGDLRLHFQSLVTLVNAELKGRKFFALEVHGSYFNDPRLFGQEVFNNFSSATDDITEAGSCLSLNRPTACVMHLMRVLEVGLASLAAEMGIKKQNDWGSYLREIDRELERRIKASGARSPDEQFFAEASKNIDDMRRAYRNPTMHPDKSYSVERANDILQSVRSFMRHLATKLHD